jgi:hypothetical protein
MWESGVLSGLSEVGGRGTFAAMKPLLCILAVKGPCGPLIPCTALEAGSVEGRGGLPTLEGRRCSFGGGLSGALAAQRYGVTNDLTGTTIDIDKVWASYGESFNAK